jgi:hypothetical protein
MVSPGPTYSLSKCCSEIEAVALGAVDMSKTGVRPLWEPNQTMSLRNEL